MRDIREGSSAEGFAEAGRRLTELTGRAVVLAGTGAERDLAAEVRHAIGPSARSVAGLVDLAGFAALVARAPVLIANNSGPVHVAAAVGTPVVDLYALTNPQHTPWGCRTACSLTRCPASSATRASARRATATACGSSLLTRSSARRSSCSASAGPRPPDDTSRRTRSGTSRRGIAWRWRSGARPRRRRIRPGRTRCWSVRRPRAGGTAR